MDEAKPMTSVFYDVIRLEAVRGGYNVPIEGHFWRFWGNLNPKMLSAIVWIPKGTSFRHNACFEPSCVKFHARVTSIGESGEKIKKRGLIFHVFRQTFPCGRLAQILGYVFVSWTQFYRNRLRGLDSVRGRSLTIPIGLRCRRYHCFELTSPLWFYTKI